MTDLQQAIEKLLKSLLAYKNREIPKSHYLDELASLIDEIKFNDEEMLVLEKTTDSYGEGRYPNPHYVLPTKAEAKEILDFAEALFCRVSCILGVDGSGVKC